MKTKVLIEKLRAIDPTGEMHVTVGKVDIFFLSREPYYYDGKVQRLIRDPAKAPYYDVVAAEFPKEDHVKIHTHCIESALWDCPDMPVECHGDEELEARVAKWRAEARKEA